MMPDRTVTGALDPPGVPRFERHTGPAHRRWSSQVSVRMLRYHVVCDRRVAKNTRKTLNDRRRSSGTVSWVPSPTPSDPGSAEDPPQVSEELIRLACLCQAGVITDSEFDRAKARMLAELRQRRQPS
jgi:hypothetical protein